MQQPLYLNFRHFLQKMQLQVRKLHKDAKIPVKSTNYAAGYDLYSLESAEILPHCKTIMKTGISIRIPALPNPFKVYGSIRSRSGLSAKYNIEVGAGVIDFDYEQEIKVILYNHSNNPIRFEKHTRIAQLVLEVHITPEIEEVSNFKNIENNNRDGGFGSTGEL